MEHLGGEHDEMIHGDILAGYEWVMNGICMEQLGVDIEALPGSFVTPCIIQSSCMTSLNTARVEV